MRPIAQQQVQVALLQISQVDPRTPSGRARSASTAFSALGAIRCACASKSASTRAATTSAASPPPAVTAGITGTSRPAAGAVGSSGAVRERLLPGRGLLRLLHIALDRLCLLPRRHLSRPEATDGRQPRSTLPVPRLTGRRVKPRGRSRVPACTLTGWYPPGRGSPEYVAWPWVGRAFIFAVSGTTWRKDRSGSARRCAAARSRSCSLPRGASRPSSPTRRGPSKTSALTSM